MKNSLLLFCFLLPVCASAADVKPLITDANVVQIAVALPPNNANSLGTGFFVGDDDLIVTAGHVYLAALNSLVDNRAGTLIARRFSRAVSHRWIGTPIDLIAADYAHDIVLLKIRAENDSWKSAWNEVGGVSPLALDSGSAPGDGDGVQMRGYFGADEFPVFLSGSVAGTASLGPLSVQELLIILPAVPGQSGSPLVSSAGRVVGIITAIVPVALPFNQQPAHSGLTRAVAIEHVNRLLSSLKK